jgi:hypothetical protein
MGMAGRLGGVVALTLAMSCGGTGGSTGSAAPDAGSSPPDGGATRQDGGGSPDAGLVPPDGGAPGQDGGQSDGGSDGGTAPDACRALMTAPPGQPVVYRTDPLPPYEYGVRGTTDGRGEVLVPITATFDSLSLSIFDPSGRLLSNPLGLGGVGGGSFGLDAIGVADGFIGVQSFDFAFIGHQIAKVFSDGGTQETELDAGLASQGEDPRGGMRVLVSAAKVLAAYDSDLGARWETRLPITDWDPNANFERLPVGVDTGGNSLVLFPPAGNQPNHPQDGGVLGIWTDAQGHPGTAFDIQQNTPAFCLRFMASLTGGLFVRENCFEESGTFGRFVASFKSLDPHPGPVPDWLAQRPAIDLRRIRSGTGYAAINAANEVSTLTGHSGCSIEVLTPDGRSCGQVDFGPSVAASDSLTTDAGGSPGPSCALAVGADGTVIALTEEGNEINGTNRWTWHWWPGFFR